MHKIKIYSLFLLAIIFAIINLKCTAVYDTIVNIQRLKFKLGTVDNFHLAGVKLSSASGISQLNITDGAKIIAAFGRGELPVSFTLNVLAKNPNDGTGGTKNTTAIIKSLAWRLFLDDKETINGNIPNSIEVPGVGQETKIPIAMSLDLMKFLKEQGYESLVNLAFALGGVSGSAARIKLKATPTIDTFLGPITYPGELTIVDTEFRSE
jgi:hypothetical protein